MKAELSLLEYLAGRLGCAYLSNLRFLGAGQRAQLAREIRKIPAEAAALWEWNDTLKYLTQVPSCATPQEARTRLLNALSSPREASVG